VISNDKTVAAIVKEVFGSEILKKLESVEEYPNFSIFYEDHKFVPYEVDGKKETVWGILDYMPKGDFILKIATGNILFKVYLTDYLYFELSKIYVDQRDSEEDENVEFYYEGDDTKKLVKLDFFMFEDA